MRGEKGGKSDAAPFLPGWWAGVLPGSARYNLIRISEEESGGQEIIRDSWGTSEKCGEIVKLSVVSLSRQIQDGRN